jgi:hypothetical protein
MQTHDHVSKSSLKSFDPWSDFDFSLRMFGGTVFNVLAALPTAVRAAPYPSLWSGHSPGLEAVFGW